MARPRKGSKRDMNMVTVKAWLLHNPAGAQYPDIAAATGLSIPAVQKAVSDLQQYDPDLVVSVPAPKNGYIVRAHWNHTSMRGEGNQGRHFATRAERMAVRWDKASKVETDPARAALWQMNASLMKTVAENIRTAERALG